MINAYEAVSENPRVFCAFGETPAKAVKSMSKILKENNIEYICGSNVGYLEEDDLHYINIYV